MAEFWQVWQSAPDLFPGLCQPVHRDQVMNPEWSLEIYLLSGVPVHVMINQAQLRKFFKGHQRVIA